MVAKDGRFGVYVTDGETNASIGKGDRIETMDPERAYELLAIRRQRARVIAKRRGPGQEERRRRPRQEDRARKSPAKKSAAKKSAAREKA